MSGSRRTERLNGLIHEELSRIILRVVKDPRVKGVTFTHVKVSKDLRHARIYYSLLGGSDDRSNAEKGLQSAKGVMRREIGRNLQLRYTPELEFFFDDSLEYAEHIEKLLKDV